MPIFFDKCLSFLNDKCKFEHLNLFKEPKSKMDKSLLFVCMLCAGVLAVGCSEYDMPNHAEEAENDVVVKKYDARFPDAMVWVEDNGEMHLDDDMTDFKAPSADEFHSVFAGNGWKFGSCCHYQYDKENGPLFSVLNCAPVWGDDPRPCFYIADEHNAMVYTSYIGTDGSGWNPDDITPDYSVKTVGYEYDESTGVVDLYLFKWYKLLRISDGELWFGNVDKDADAESWTLVKYVPATPEEVAQWNLIYQND